MRSTLRSKYIRVANMFSRFFQILNNSVVGTSKYYIQLNFRGKKSEKGCAWNLLDKL
jgi:hypothetical protein